MTIPFGTPEPSDGLLNKSVSSTRLRAWLNTRLRQLAVGQRIQDARALRSAWWSELALCGQRIRSRHTFAVRRHPSAQDDRPTPA